MRGLVLLLAALGVACESGGAPSRAVEKQASTGLTPSTPPTRVETTPAPMKVLASLQVPDARSIPKALSNVTVPRRVNRNWTGLGCQRPEVLALHGFLGDQPVRATLTLRAERMTLDVVSTSSGKTTQFRGHWDGKICSAPSEVSAGRLEATSGQQAPLLVSLLLPGALALPAEHPWLTFKGRRESEEASSLELWERAEDARNVLDPYLRALRTAANIDAVVAAPPDVTVLAYSEAGSPRLRLAALAGSPLAVKHSLDTGLDCGSGDTCAAKLVGNDLGDGTALLVVTLEGVGTRGQGTFRSAKGALSTLTTAGFVRGATLPETERGDTSHGTQESRTSLYWVVDGDRRGPPAILSRHRHWSPGVAIGTDTLPGWDRTSYQLFAFDPYQSAFLRGESKTPSPTLVESLERGRPLAAF